MSLEDIKILYEDDDVLAIDKPAGLSVHSDGYSSEPTLVDWLLGKYPNLREVGEPMFDQGGNKIEKPGLVHRLDKDTSGVMVVAKNQPAFLFLKEQFQNHAIRKAYRLLVYGEFKQEAGFEGVIDLPIGRSKKDPRRRVARLKSPGKLREAVTDYEILEKFKDYTYIEARPKTGRTHQIRVHFKAINHPLVCDKLYAPNLPCLPGLARQALHAFRLGLILPGGRPVTIEASLPGDIKQALETLKTL